MRRIVDGRRRSGPTRPGQLWTQWGTTGAPYALWGTFSRMSVGSWRGCGVGVTGPSGNVVFERLPIAERSRLLAALRQETVGGALLLGAAVVNKLPADSLGEAVGAEMD